MSSQVFVHEGFCSGPITLIEGDGALWRGTTGCNDFGREIVEPLSLQCDGSSVRAVSGCTPVTPVPEPGLTMALLVGAVFVGAVEALNARSSK